MKYFIIQILFKAQGCNISWVVGSPSGLWLNPRHIKCNSDFVRMSEESSEKMEESTSCSEVPQEENKITISRSVSLTRTEKKTMPPKKAEKERERKRKNPPEVSPKVSVLERKSRFERVQEKYRSQRCLKENKEKSKIERNKPKREKTSKTPSEDSDESVASLLKKIHADITIMKTDLKENTSQIASINTKVTAIERDNARVEAETNLKFENIRYDMRLMETSVTAKVVNEL